MAFVLDHPLAAHRLALLRDRNTAPRQFRALIGDLAAMLIAALITIVPVCLLVLAVLALAGYFFIV